ncbi:MAG TPA: hypothetical protein DEB56_07135 [Thiobacillus sp.]|nr:hypothetical protein [Thiobacillus sp.]
MATAGQITAGLAKMRVDGKLWKVNSVSLSIGTTTREVVQSMSGPGGIKVTPVSPHGTATVVVGSADKIADLAAISDSTIEFEIGSGFAYTFTHACCSNQPEYDAGEGTCSFEWQAQAASETK